MKQVRFIYFFYLILIILIVWLGLQLSGIYSLKQNRQVPEVTEFFDDTLTFVLPDFPGSANNFKALWDVDWFLCRQLYRGLTKINYDLSVSPDLAEYWEISDDFQEYTFHLRDDIVFQDGTPITAEDVVFSMYYFFKNYKQVYAVHYFNAIQGLEEFLQGKSSRISGIEKVSDKVVRIRLNYPYVPFLKTLSMPYMSVLPARLLKAQGERFFEHPVGSGPYELVSMDEHTILLKASQKVRIYSPGVKFFKFFNYLDTTFEDNFWSQKWDICTVYTDTFVTHPHHVKYYKNISFGSVFIGFNCEKFPTSDKWFRKMIFHSVMLDSIMQLLQGTIIPASFITPLYLPSHRGTSYLLNTDLEKARDILKTKLPEWGNLDSLKVVVLLDTVGFDKAFNTTFQLLQDSLHIPVEFVYKDVIYDTCISCLANQFNLFFFNWEMDVGDPDFFLGLLFYSGSPLNVFHYHNPVVDSLILISRVLETEPERLKVYAQIEKVVYEDAPVRSLFNSLSYIFYKDYIQSAYTSRYGFSHLNLENISVDKKLYLAHCWKRTCSVKQ